MYRSLLTIAFATLFIATAAAQKVPKERLDKVINDFAKDGYKLEQMYEPDFKVSNPNTPSRFAPCYTGKSVIIAGVMAFKPKDLMFRVLLNGKEAPKTHEPESIGGNGFELYYDYRALNFGSKFVSTNQSCMNIMLYDKAAPAKPVYTLIFTKPNNK